jgi:integrase
MRQKTATFLKLLKETAMRPGEAWQLEWIDFDQSNRTLICKHPEKNSRSRAFDNISPELCQMLLSLPHNSQYIFSCSKTPLSKEDWKEHVRHLQRQKGLLGKQRSRIALKLKNPRIAEISYCSCRHYKATQLYHQTKDILYVMKFLGHRNIKNTLIYIDLDKLSYPHGGENYHAKTAKTETEALQLVEAGFDYVCSMGEVKLFRKRK